MSCGRESRSADAAWRVRLLALVFFLSVMPHGALSRGLALRPLRELNITCNKVPYPFGTRGKYLLPGFEVTCGPNNEAMLPIGDHRYRIDEVSVEGGFIIILVGAIRQVCYDHNGKPKKSTGIGGMSLQGTPFSFSSRNKLVATGCNYMLVAIFEKPPVSDINPPQTTACFSWCNNGSTSSINCHHGVACCEAAMPMNGSQEFALMSERISTSGHITSDENNTCSTVFFEEDVSVDGSDDEKEGALLSAGDHRMVLDWTVGPRTCDQARYTSFEPPYCNDMSGCVDAPSGAGYLCKCNAGYGGNPYAAHGCVDINECRNNDSNGCINQNYCNNTEGYRTGTGCTEASIPSGSPLQQPQGLNSCTHLETNPCEYPKYCTDVPGDVWCDCPRGMSGDGRKKGRGCQKHFPIDIVTGVGLALVVTVTTTALCYYWSMKRREARRKRAELFRKNGGLLLQQRFSAITSQGKDSSAKIFSAKELKTATNNYSESQILGRGGYGTVYKGVLPDDTVFAVKKSRVFEESQVEQFVNEITILSQTDHPNVVKLLGCCLETQVPLLVYEFIPNGTLFQHIHNRSPPHSLTWEDTLRIAGETAEGLAYLHSTSSIPIIHRDIKSSNILLDENFVAKISDFGASRSVPFDQTHVTTLIQGTIGYLDPEYFQSSMLTEKSDVYSFGVVLAELLTRQKPISVGRSEESCNLAMHIVILFSEGRLLQEIEPNIVEEAGEEQLYAVAQLSVRCLNLSGQERPVMKEVASVLNELRQSFAKQQTMRRKDEPVQKNNELLREARPISSTHCSEGSTQFSIEAEMIASSHSPR